jgi:hypothetical protein
MNVDFGADQEMSAVVYLAVRHMSVEVNDLPHLDLQSKRFYDESAQAHQLLHLLAEL